MFWPILLLSLLFPQTQTAPGPPPETAERPHIIQVNKHEWSFRWQETVPGCSDNDRYVAWADDHTRTLWVREGLTPAIEVEVLESLLVEALHVENPKVKHKDIGKLFMSLFVNNPALADYVLSLTKQ